jgi:hypothetical protein
MLKRAVIYGLAFGSLSASMVLIFLMNELYRQRNWLSALPMLANIIIVGVGVYLFIKGSMKITMEKPLTLGKALFWSLIVGLFASLVNVGTYQYIQNNKSNVYQTYISVQKEAMKNHILADSNILQKDKAVKIQEAEKSIDENFHWGSFARSEIQMSLSIALIITLLVYLANSKR